MSVSVGVDPGGFAQRIKIETDAAHRAAEQSGYVADLLDGRLAVGGYVALLEQTYLIYRTLEAATDRHASERVLAPFLSPELLRVPSLEADLEFLGGPDWREAIEPLPATRRYTERIDTVADQWPAGLVAHHYIRYLGDLSGGQIIRRHLERAYGFDRDGLRFYIFDGIEKTKPFKDAYRARLDALDLDERDQRRFIDEVIAAYAFNASLFADLDGAARPFRLPEPTDGAGER